MIGMDAQINPARTGSGSSSFRSGEVLSPPPDLRNPATWPFSDYDYWYSKREIEGTDPLPTRESAVKMAREIAVRAKKHLGGKLLRVWLHGSRARGDQTPHSDLDILTEQVGRPSLEGLSAWEAVPALEDYLTMLWCEKGIVVNVWELEPGQWENGAPHILGLIRKYAIRVL